MPRSQSAMEYLTTYSWAILIMGIVIAALYALGVFNVNGLAPNVCALPANFGCLSAALLATGSLSVNIQQSTSSPIYVTAIGCNDQGTSTNMQTVSPQVYLEIGSNATFTLNCYYKGAVYGGKLGSLYNGYLILNYTEVQSGFQHEAVGRLIEKVV